MHGWVLQHGLDPGHHAETADARRGHDDPALGVREQQQPVPPTDRALSQVMTPNIVRRPEQLVHSKVW